MHVSHVTSALEAIAPLDAAESWDNVGLLIGGAAWPVRRVLLTIDLTASVLAEAIETRAKMIVAYHPPLFEPLRSLTEATPRERIILEAARASIAVYSPHTALDAAEGGVNDWLAGALGDGDVRALQTTAELPASETHKIVTFCPRPAVDRLRETLASVGAGRIGAYELCSFELEGTGTFRGGPGTRPQVGRRGALERVPEVRLEMVSPTSSLALAVTTLRQHHPYEEPPIEIYALSPRPRRGAGMGRRVVLDRKQALRPLLESIKTRLGVHTLRVATGDGAPGRYGTIGLCAGAGGSLLDSALADGCELFLTGEMRHHDILAGQARGATIVLAGHTNTERGYLRVLRRRLRAAIPGLDVTVARRDRDPLKAM